MKYIHTGGRTVLPCTRASAPLPSPSPSAPPQHPPAPFPPPPAHSPQPPSPGPVLITMQPPFPISQPWPPPPSPGPFLAHSYPPSWKPSPHGPFEKTFEPLTTPMAPGKKISMPFAIDDETGETSPLEVMEARTGQAKHIEYLTLSSASGKIELTTLFCAAICASKWS